MLRWLGAGLVWILAGLVGLVGALLCVTIILLPLGIPALMLAKRLFSLAARLVLPRVVTKPTSMVKDPARKLGRRARKAGERAAAGGGSALDSARERSRRAASRTAGPARPWRRRPAAASGSGSSDGVGRSGLRSTPRLRGDSEVPAPCVPVRSGPRCGVELTLRAGLPVSDP